MTEAMHHNKKPVNIIGPVEVGCGESQVLVVTEIPLRPSAQKIVDISREVEVTSCKAINNKVIINGELRKVIMYLPECGGAGGSGNNNRRPNQGSGGGSDNHMQCRIRSSDVKATCVNAPFAMFIDVPGAREGDICIIEDASVVGSKEEELHVHNDGSFGALLEKTVVQVVARVAKHCHTPVRPEWP